MHFSGRDFHERANCTSTSTLKSRVNASESLVPGVRPEGRVPATASKEIVVNSYQHRTNDFKGIHELNLTG